MDTTELVGLQAQVAEPAKDIAFFGKASAYFAAQHRK